MKNKKVLWALMSLVSGLFIIFVSMLLSGGGVKGWFSSHMMNLSVWITDGAALAVASLVFYIGTLFTQTDAMKEEHREQLEATIRQAQQLEQENIQLCDELDILQAQGVGDPVAIEEARHAAEKLQKENAKLMDRLQDLEEENAVNIRKFQDDNQRLQAQLQVLEASHRENQQLLENVLKQVADLEQTNQDLNRQLSEKSETVVTVTNTVELEEARSRMAQLEHKNSDLVVQLQTVEQRYRSNEAQLAKALSQVSDLETANAALYHRISEMEVSNSGEQTRVSAAINVVHQLEQENSQLREQINSLEATNADNQAYFQRTIAQLENRNRDLQMQIEQVQAGNVSTRTYVDEETRRMTEQLLETVRLQMEAQTHQMDAMAHTIQYHRAELGQLRQEMRAMRGGTPLPTPSPQPPLPAEPANEVVASFRTNGHMNGSAKPSISMVSTPSYSEPVAIKPEPAPTTEPQANEDEVYLSLLRSRIELEERMRQARHTGT